MNFLKKSVCISIILFSSLFHAQEENRKSYGFFAGPNFYSTRTIFQPSGETTFAGSSFGNNVQYHFGAFMDIEMKENLGLFTSAGFQQRGVEMMYSRKNSSFQLSYIDLSTSLKYDTQGIYGKGFYLKGGFRFSFLASSKINGEAVNTIFKRVNFGLLGGIGSDINKYIGIELLVDYSPMNYYEAPIKSKFVGANFRFLFNITNYKIEKTKGASDL